MQTPEDQYESHDNAKLKNTFLTQDTLSWEEGETVYLE